MTGAPLDQDAADTKNATDFNLVLFNPDDDEKYITQANIAFVGEVKFSGRARPDSVSVLLTLLKVKDDKRVICQSAIGKSHALGDDDSLIQITGHLKPPNDIKPGYYVVRASVTDRSSDDGVNYVDSDSALIRLVARQKSAKGKK